MALDELLSQYEQAQAVGAALTPEELCREHPELLEQVRWHAKALRFGNVPSHIDSSTDTATAAVESANTATEYRVLRPHARGGLGEVLLARDDLLGRDVALKIIRQPLAHSRDRRDRFAREAEITSRLEHPGIVPVYGIGTGTDGRPCYAMRFVAGATLDEALHQFHAGQGALTRANPQFRQLLGRLQQVCNTIAYAHERGIIHRDLKPANILLGNFGETLVVDWGLAKVIDNDTKAGEVPTSDHPFVDTGGETTAAGTVLGTPAYMSPEQGAGQDVGPGSDIFALGAIMYALLTGKSPYGGCLPGELNRRISAADFVRPRAVRSDIPAPLEAICLKAMSRDPGSRYASPLVLSSDVEHWLADEPITAQPDRWWVQLRRWSKRHRVLVTSAGSAVVVALLGLTVATIMLEKRNVQLDAARTVAEADLATARAAVAQFTTRVATDERLLDVDAAELQRALLDDAVAYFRTFIDRHGDRPELAAELGRAHHQLARAFEATGRTNEAIQQAQAALLKLPADDPTIDSVCLVLGRTLTDAGRLADAEEPLATALALRQRRAGDDANSRSAVGDVANQCGQLFARQHRFAAAEKSYLDALAWYKTATGAVVAENESTVAAILINLGSLVRRVGAHAQAEDYDRRAIALLHTAPANRENQRRLGRLHNHLSVTLFNQEKFRPAAEEAQRAAEVFAALHARWPSHAEYAAQLVEARSARAWTLVKLRDFSAAASEFSAARALAEQMAAKLPDSLDCQDSLALVELREAEFAFRTDRLTDAERLYGAARDRFRRLSAAHATTHGRLPWGQALNGYGLTLNKLNRPDDGRAALQQSFEILDRLFENEPDDHSIVIALGNPLFNLAAAHIERQEYEPAEEYLTRIMAIHQKHRDCVGTDLPSDKQFRQAVQRRGDVRNQLGDLIGSRADFERTVDMTAPDDPTLPMYRSARAAARARTGDHRLAIVEAEELLENKPNLLVRYQTSGTLALAAGAVARDASLPESERGVQAEHLAAKAVVLLVALDKDGWFRQPDRRAELESDTDFAFLRSRQDFQAVLTAK